MVQLIIFLGILSALVLVHEWGHYIFAKIFGVRVEEFGFGLPPRARKLFTRKGTLFSLNWLPIGGFVKLYGEEYSDGDGLLAGENGRFYDKPARARAVILTAGVIMNFLLGILLFAVVYSFVGIPVKTDRVRIVEVVADSPAAVAGVAIDERVAEFRFGEITEKISDTTQLVKLVTENAGNEIDLLVMGKEGGERLVKVTPRKDPPAGQGALGVILSNVELTKFPWWQMPFRGAVVGLSEAIAWGRDIAGGLGKMVYGLVTGRGCQMIWPGRWGFIRSAAR